MTEWDDSVIWVVDEVRQRRGPEATEQWLQDRLENGQRERALEGLAWLRRQQDDEN